MFTDAEVDFCSHNNRKSLMTVHSCFSFKQVCALLQFPHQFPSLGKDSDEFRPAWHSYQILANGSIGFPLQVIFFCSWHKIYFSIWGEMFRLSSLLACLKLIPGCVKYEAELFTCWPVFFVFVLYKFYLSTVTSQFYANTYTPGCITSHKALN